MLSVRCTKEKENNNLRKHNIPKLQTTTKYSKWKIQKIQNGEKPITKLFF